MIVSIEGAVSRLSGRLLTKSDAVTIPTNAPSSKTARRPFWAIIVWAAFLIVAVGSILWIGVDMTSMTRTVSGSFPAASTRLRRSRSVKIPWGAPAARTMRLPIRFAPITRAASAIEA